MGTELGGAGTVTPAALQIAERGSLPRPIATGDLDYQRNEKSAPVTQREPRPDGQATA
jgi:hypothetical protein